MGLSISIIAPTIAMAFNVSLAVQVAGPAAPLAFAIGTAAILIVGLSFVASSRRVAHAGSAYGYITQAFGGGWGFMAGWALLLTYLAYGAGTSALIGNFVEAAAETCGFHQPGLWLAVSVAATMLATYFARRNMRLASRMMLALEGLSILAILVLSILILVKVSSQHQLSGLPFAPSPSHRGWAGVGYAMVFAVLSFGGFEAAATLGEETRNPRRNIPIAILGTVLIAGSLYVFVCYAQVVGYGPGNSDALGRDTAPLNTLALRYASRSFAVGLDLAAALGGFSCVLGSLSAAGRMLFALSRAGLAPRLGDVHAVHGTPAAAIALSGGFCLLCLLGWAPHAGAGNYYGYMGTIGTLALILVYMGVACAQAKYALTKNGKAGAVVGGLGLVVLLWPLYNSVYPSPDYPNNLWPYVTLTWLACGALLLLVRPAVARQRLSELMLESSIDS